MARKITITWPELDIGVTASLAEEANPDLCEEFCQSLPFGIVQSHPVVSGSSVTMWLPYFSKASIATRESIVDAPTGRIRLSQATGSKLSIQYGPGLEPARQAVLGLIDDEHLGVLPRVGREVWENLFWRKQQLTVHFAALPENASPAGGEAPEPQFGAAHPLASELAAAAQAITLAEPEDVVRLRSGEVPDAGSFDQYFSVWVAAHGMVRDFVVSTLFPIYGALRSHGLESARLIYGTVAVTYHFSLKYHGFAQLAEFATRFHSLLEQSDDHEEVEGVFEQLLLYANLTYAWSHQAFPWYLGMSFPTPGAGPVGGRWRLTS